jgi:bacterioferritin
MGNEFLLDIEKIRDRARQHMERGAVTDSYRADVKRVIDVLNEVLATEIVCNLRYRRHYHMASSIHAQSVAAEFLEHAKEEQQHAEMVAERIAQLGGEPDFSPEGLATRSHSQYDRERDLKSMIQEDLIAERIAIQSYSEVVRWLGDDDPTSRRVMEEILRTEEEHADDLVRLLSEFDKVYKSERAA